MSRRPASTSASTSIPDQGRVPPPVGGSPERRAAAVVPPAGAAAAAGARASNGNTISIRLTVTTAGTLLAWK